MSSINILIEEKISFFSFCNSNSLDPRLTKACTQKLGYTSPTLVQAKAVPLALAGRDLLVRARTGSGKTAAYGLVLLQKILIAKCSENVKSRGGGVRALILVPTRELVDQTTQALLEMASFCTDCVSIFALGGAAAASGGLGSSSSTKSKAAVSADAARLVAELPDVIVSTPFRMAAVLSSGSVKNGDTINGLLKTLCDTLIVDEADLVLSFGYEADMRTCIAALPRIRQSMLLSATLSPELDELRKLVLHSPAILKLHEEISSSSTTTSGTKNGVEGAGGGGYAPGTSGILTQFYVRVPRIDRFLLLYSLLKLRLLSGKTLIFTNSVGACFKLKLFLERFSISAAVLNAELPANSRQNIINQFNKGLFDLLIATDEGVAEDAPQEEEVGEEEEGVEKEKKITDGVFDASVDIDNDISITASAGLKRKRGKSTKKEEQKSGKRSKNAQLLGQLKDSEYGVSRGVDFRAVTTVVNFDFPLSASSYIHRVGRTARGGLAGVALSLVAPEGVEEKQDVVLKELFKVLPPAPGTGFPQPSPLPFNIGEIEGFRYRVEDVLQSVTDGQIKEARLTELRREILASQALRAHFEDNPRDLAVLQHEKALNPQKVKTHLRAVPTYLLPPSLRAAAEAAGGGISSGKGGKGGKGGKRGRNAPRNEDSSNKGHGEMDVSSTSDTRDTTRSAVYSASKSSAVDPLKSFAISQDKAASIAGKIKASLASGGGGGGGRR
jgi:ATP-dependent RNA helicase DDX56/DBP9